MKASSLFLACGSLKDSYGLRGNHEEIDNSYIPRCVEEVLGKDARVHFENNIPAAFDFFQAKHPSGLIVPQGHGDRSVLGDFEERLGREIEIPVFEAFRHVGRYSHFYNDPMYTVMSIFARFTGSSEFGIREEEKREKDGLVEKAFREWLAENIAVQKHQI